MKQFHFWKLFLDFFRRYRLVTIYYGLFLIIFCMICFVCSIPYEAAEYALLLNGVLGLFFILYSFFRYAERYRILKAQEGRILYELDGLPEAIDEIERMYQELLRNVFYEKTQAQTKAAEERKELDDYYTMWLHQIKTPIAAMRLLLQTEEDRDPAALKLELFKIEQYAQMALQYLRIESMSEDLVLGKYSLEAMIRQAIRNYSMMFILKNIKLELVEFHAKVLTDEKWLVFVLEQLLSNALKYTQEGNIRIRYDSKNEILLIEDSGIGIAPEDLPRVFERGFTGYNGRDDKKATGLGLYLCKRILDKLGHEIFLTSKVGEGTMVYLFFRREDVKDY